MRNIIVSEFIALDGVVENPAWTFAFESQERNDYKFAELRDAGALLLGRVTFEGFAQAWPGMREQTGDYGAWMNDYPKHVVSTTLREATWKNSSLINGDVAEEIRALKAQSGKDILVFGSGTLVNFLLQNDLADEYRLMTFPVVVGTGKRLFESGHPQKTLKLVKTELLGSSVVVLTYRPERAA